MEKEIHAEDFVRIINQAKKEEEEYNISLNKDIKKGFMIIGYEKYEFIEKEVIEKKLKIFMPKEFDIMDEEDIMSKYPDEERPDIIFTNFETDINITFSVDDGEVENGEIKEITVLLKDQMKRIYSGSRFEKEEFIVKESGQIIGCIGFNVPVVDGEIFTKMFFMELDENLLIGTISYDMRDANEWSPIANQMIESIEIIEDINGEQIRKAKDEL